MNEKSKKIYYTRGDIKNFKINKDTNSLIAIINDKNQPFRKEALGSLGNIVNFKDFLDVLIEIFKNEDKWDYRDGADSLVEEILSIFERTGNKRVVEILVNELLKNSNSGEKETHCWFEFENTYSKILQTIFTLDEERGKEIVNLILNDKKSCEKTKNIIVKIRKK